MQSVPLGSILQSSAVIPLNGTSTPAIALGGMTIVGVQLPAALTGTALSFQASTDIAGTFTDVYNAAGKISITVAASRWVTLDPKDFQGLQFIKIVSGSTELAARTLGLTLKGI